jgi:hypothetical protein
VIAKTKASFSKRMLRVTQCHEELILAIYKKTNEKSLKTMLVEQYVMLGVVSWETHLHDLFVVYIQSKPEVAISSMEQRITQSVEGKFGGRAADCIRFDVKKPLTTQRIESLLDPKNWNITVKSSNELASKANNWLHAKYAKAFSLDKADSQFLDFAIAMRNYLSHRSAGSRSTLKAALGNLSEAPNSSLIGSVRDLGAYLKHITPSGRSRAVEFVNRLMDIAGKL